MKYLKLIPLSVLILLTNISITQCGSGKNINQEKSFLSDNDQNMLLLLLEEDKMARDVYTKLYQEWDLKQFGNISKSEQRHTNSIQQLLDDLNVPYEILEPGQFHNQEIKALYDKFIERGLKGPKEALFVGATIEDLDIKDLQEAINSTDNQSVITVLEKLLCGSKNHMRAFSRGIAKYDSKYIPQYISTSEYADILNAGNGRCG